MIYVCAFIDLCQPKFENIMTVFWLAVHISYLIFFRQQFAEFFQFSCSKSEPVSLMDVLDHFSHWSADTDEGQ